MRASLTVLSIAIAAVLASCSADRPATSAKASAAVAAEPSTARPATSIAGHPDRGTLFEYDDAAATRVGASTWHAVDISEAHALRAAKEGHLVIQAPGGESIQVAFERKLDQVGGNWSWVGHREGAQGGPVVLTFGKHAVFGTIPDGNNGTLQVTTRGGRSWVVQTDAARANRDEPTTAPDFIDTPITQASIGADAAAMQTQGVSSRMAVTAAGSREAIAAMSAPATTASAAMVAAAATPAMLDTRTVDVVLGYTTGYAARWGGTSGAVTRLNYLVTLGNTAYNESQVAGRLRIAAAIQVDYPDATSNQSALFALTGVTCTNSSTGANRLPDTGSDCSRPGTNAALKPLITAREQYGADLVALVRNFNSPENGSCGIAWLNGGAQKPITTGSSDWGFAAVSDSGGDQFPDGSTCREEYLAHELGHNLGLQHDRLTAQHATDTDGDGDLLDPEEFGRFPFSFGYNTDATQGNFATIMSLRRNTQTALPVFSNPRISTCNGFPCGDAATADNARTLGLTLPYISGFRLETTPLSNTWLRGDFNGDGKSDFVWRNRVTGHNVIWRSGAASQQQQIAPVADLNWSIVGVGDFNGDGRSDLVWRNGANGQNVIWPSATSTLQQKLATLAPNWILAGVGDFDGDGKSDLLWRDDNTGQNAIWRSGNAATAIATASAVPAWRVVGIGDFNGDHRSDILWRNSVTGQNGVWRSGSAASSMALTAVVNLAWRVVGVGDFDGDGVSDILWHSGATGQTTYWKSGNGTQNQVLYTVADLRWVPQGVGDFDNDGKDDVLWRNFATGGNVAWRSATSTQQLQMIPVTDPTWVISG
jgi:peptidyl-Asp metalloendopeptidase